MPATYTLISSNVLTSSAASVTFSAIPATYTDLVLRVSARSDGTIDPEEVHFRFNNDTTNLYSYVKLQGNGASATSALAANTTVGRGFFASDLSTQTSNTFGSGELYIPSYTASQSKPVGMFGVEETNATTANMAASAALYRSNTAISRIDLLPRNGTNFVSGSSFYLYGISNA